MTVSNSHLVTGLTLTITVATAGDEQYSSLSPNTSAYARTLVSSSGEITYTWTLAGGKTISAGHNTIFKASFKDKGRQHAFSGDTYSWTATSNGVIQSGRGTF